MVKKNYLYVAVFAMLFLLVTACSGGGSELTSNQEGNGDAANTANEEEPIKLVVTTGVSPSHAWIEGFMIPWMEKVTEKTNGRVQFEQFHNGELVDFGKEYDAMLQGVADVSLLSAIYDPQRFPMSEVTMLPLTYSDVHIASKAFTNLLKSDVPLKDGKTFAEIEFGDAGLAVLGFPTTMEYTISTGGKEFNSVNDVIGTTLRSASRIHEIYNKSIGANTINMPGTEIFEALSRGAIDGVFHNVADWSGLGFQDLMKYALTGINFGHFNSTIAMTQEKWESLPEDVRQIMVETAEELIPQGADFVANRGDEMRDYFLDKGGKFVDLEELDPEVQEHLTKGIEDTWFNYIDILNERGIPGKEVVKLWRDLVVEAGGRVPEGIMNLE